MHQDIQYRHNSSSHIHSNIFRTIWLRNSHISTSSQRARCWIILCPNTRSESFWFPMWKSILYMYPEFIGQAILCAYEIHMHKYWYVIMPKYSGGMSCMLVHANRLSLRAKVGDCCADMTLNPPFPNPLVYTKNSWRTSSGTLQITH